VDRDKAVTVDLLGVLDDWVRDRVGEWAAEGWKVDLTRGPADRTPAAAWVDFKSTSRSARLILWSSGAADLVVGDAMKGEVLLEEHREITGEVGLEDVEETIRAWFT
jgi:hypothetical protein